MNLPNESRRLLSIIGELQIQGRDPAENGRPKVRFPAVPRLLVWAECRNGTPRALFENDEDFEAGLRDLETRGLIVGIAVLTRESSHTKETQALVREARDNVSYRRGDGWLFQVKVGAVVGMQPSLAVGIQGRGPSKSSPHVERSEWRTAYDAWAVGLTPAGHVALEGKAETTMPAKGNGSFVVLPYGEHWSDLTLEIDPFGDSIRVSDKNHKTGHDRHEFGLSAGAWRLLQGLAVCNGDLGKKAKDGLPDRTRKALERLNDRLAGMFGRRFEGLAVIEGKARFTVRALPDAGEEERKTKIARLEREQRRDRASDAGSTD